MGRAGWGAIFAVLIVATASCSTAPSLKVQPSRDISDARPVAREVGNILLSFSAYNYAVVGGLNAERIRVVTPDRYAAVARAQASVISDNATKIIALAVDTAGPVRDRLVTLADALAVLRTDALAYADARRPDALARIIDDVDTGWKLLRDLESLLKDDGALDKTVERGASIRTAAAPGQQALVTIGPFAGAAEAADRAKALGPNAVPATTSPFVVRIVYKDRASADASATALQKQGITAIVIDQTAYAFTRSGASPDAELWREPERFIDTRAGARKVALSGSGGLVATGSDDGFIAIFTNDGVLKALPSFNAGINQLVFTDDGRFLFGGGQLMQTWVMPQPTFHVGVPMRLTGAATSAVYIPTANAFAAASGGSSGIIGGRAPDGVPLSDPFPMEVAASGALLDSSDSGELFIGSQVAQGFEVRVVRVGVERFPRGILRIPGTARAFDVDPAGAWGAVVTDQGTFRFSLKAADPSKTIVRVAGTARDAEFGRDATLYVMEPQKLTAISGDGTTRWTQPLVDGRRLVVGARPVVLDGTDHLIAFAPADGASDSLAPVGAIQDLVVSRDGRWIGVIADARRAVLFKLQ
jgi:hypothetical protein